MRCRAPVPILLVAAVLFAFAGCGDDDDGAVPGSGETPSADDTTDAEDTTSDGDGTTTTVDDGSEDQLEALSGTARVTGSFGDEELDLMLTEETECAIQELDDDPTASVEGRTSDGDRFALDMPRMDENETTSTLELDGTVWRAGPDVTEGQPPMARLAREGKVSLVAAYVSDAGETREAELLIHCISDS